MSVRDHILARVGRRGVAAVLAALLAAGSAAGWLALRSRPSPVPASAAQPLDAPAAQTVLVFVSGAVAHPGLYELSPDARIADALAAAGGVTPRANPGRMPDLASRVHDGRQIN